VPTYQIALLIIFGIATLWWGYRLDKKNRQKELAAKRQSETQAS
jgi:cbb3-type cytochrome oxidase subunit 3